MDGLRVLVAQLAPIPHDVDANLATVLRVLDEHPDVDLAVFPELFLHGYTLPGIGTLALDRRDAAIGRLQDASAAHGTALVVGFAERLTDPDGRSAGDGLPANSALCLDEQGRVAAVYRKVHLFGDEARHFSRGHEYPVATVLGRRLAPLICFDIEFPEPARTIALAGAELLVTVSANMAPYLGEHALFARARAVENRLTHVYCNRVGVESGLTFVGGSCVVDPAGRVLDAAADGEQIRVVEVGPTTTVEPDYLAQRFPEVPAVLVPSTTPLHPTKPRTRVSLGGQS
jgi:predicted amidohydrolase